MTEVKCTPLDKDKSSAVCGREEEIKESSCCHCLLSKSWEKTGVVQGVEENREKQVVDELN